jgi:phosphoadenosine phosphosulfate reductase
MTIAYSLYRFAEDKKRYDFTVSDFYEDNCEGGPYKLFGISREKLEDVLRYLQGEKNETVRVDLTGGLDNIFLREDIMSIDILKILHA